jgi:predicted PurR-regulated permease PerM
MADPGAEPSERPEQPRVIVDVDARSYAVVVAAAFAAVALFTVVSAARDMATGIGVGALVGVALAPVVTAVQARWNLARGMAAAAVGLMLAVVIALVVFLVAPATVRQSQDFSAELPSTVEDMYSWPIVGDRLERADAAQEVEEWIDDAPANVDDSTLADVGERLLGGVFSALVVLVTALGVLVDGEVLVRRMQTLVPAPRRGGVDRMGRIVYATFGSYFAGSLFVAVLAGLVTLSAGLLLGVPLAPVAALWTTFTNLIPQIGGALGGSFFVLLALTEGPVQAVAAGVIFVIYMNIENHIIQPAIVGRAVNLSPPATMLAALVGGAAAGVPGALVATPLIGAVKAVWLDSRGAAPPPEDHRMRNRVDRVMARMRRRGEEPASERAQELLEEDGGAQAGVPLLTRRGRSGQEPPAGSEPADTSQGGGSDR